MTRSYRCLWPLAVLPFLTVILMAGGCGATRSTDAPQDTPTVTLGGYTFNSTSNVLTHPWYTVNASTPQAVLKGWGSEKGKQMTVVFSDGGRVAGVKTLRIGRLGSPSASWNAQDTQGNIHCLAVLDHGKKAARGVAVPQQGPWFVLLKASQLTVGRTWTYMAHGLTDNVQDRVMSTNATYRGRTGLRKVRDIIDANRDGAFNPNWGGPDVRMDQYFASGGHFGGVQVSATGGYAP